MPEMMLWSPHLMTMPGLCARRDIPLVLLGTHLG